MKHTRFTSAALAALTALGLVACGGSGESGETTTAPSGETTPTETTEAAYELAKEDFGGKDVTFMLWSQSTLPAEEETGDVINDATYRRNRKVEEEYNVNFKYDVSVGHGVDTSTWFGKMTSSILAGDDAFQIVGAYGYRLTGYVLDGSFHNLNDNKYIDFTKPWWPANIQEAGNIGNKLNFAIGNIETKYYDVSYALYFNKRVAEELKLESPYELVKSGKWTFDKMTEYAKLGYSDINGNSEIDVGDRYGYLCDPWMGYDAYIQAFDIKLTDTDKDGLPYLLGLTEKYADGQARLSEFVNDSGIVDHNDKTAVESFRNGLGFFLSWTIGESHNMRDMEDDFGILPFPKWDESQERYITYNALGNATAYAVPVTADLDMTSCILEALAYYGYNDILPEYYNRALKGKSARDTESEEMLDIIFDNIEFDFTQIYSYNFGNQKSPSMLMRMVTAADGDIASSWANDEQLYEETMKSILDSLK